MRRGHAQDRNNLNSATVSGSGRETSATWGAGAAEDECDFTVETVLRAPDPQGVAAISPGETLTVIVDEQAPAVEVMKGTQRVGSIVERVPRFVACARRGQHYAAEVIDIDGGVVRVRTHPA